MAATLQSEQDAYRDDNVQFIEIITQDNSGSPPSQSFLASWAGDYGFVDIPVLGTDAAESWDHISMILDRDGYIPSVWQLDETLKVVHADGGNPDPGSYL